MNFMDHFRKAIYSSIEMTFFQLADHSSDDLVIGLKELTMIGDNEKEINIEHTVDVIMRLVEREMIVNDSFITELKNIIDKLQIGKQQTKLEKKKPSTLQDLYMFYKPRQEDSIIKTGDIVEISYGNSNNNEKIKAIVMTPACDLANPGKTEYLTLDLIHETTIYADRENDKWFFIDNEQPYVVCHHEILVLKNKSLLNKSMKDSVMLYTHEFTTMTDENISFTRYKRLDEPYRSDLLHHYVSFAGRIGVPEFKAPRS
jgi:hypothetical protein